MKLTRRDAIAAVTGAGTPVGVGAPALTRAGFGEGADGESGDARVEIDGTGNPRGRSGGSDSCRRGSNR